MINVSNIITDNGKLFDSSRVGTAEAIIKVALQYLEAYKPFSTTATSTIQTLLPMVVNIGHQRGILMRENDQVFLDFNKLQEYSVSMGIGIPEGTEGLITLLDALAALSLAHKEV